MAGKTVDADKSLTVAGNLTELNSGCIAPGVTAFEKGENQSVSGSENLYPASTNKFW